MTNREAVMPAGGRGAMREERVEIPVDAESLRDSALVELRAWRASTRAAITGLLARGYAVTGFERMGDRCQYVLTPRGV